MRDMAHRVESGSGCVVNTILLVVGSIAFAYVMMLLFELSH